MLRNKKHKYKVGEAFMREMYCSNIRLICLEKLKNGEKKTNISRELGISRKTLFNWEKEAKDGKLKPIPFKNRKYIQMGRTPKINDEKEFADILNKSNGTIQNIIDCYKSTKNIIVTKQNVRTAFKKFG
jgi:transposase